MCLAVFSTGQASGCEETISKSEAKKLAAAYLKEQPWAGQYLQNPDRVTSDDHGCEWIVWFKNVNWRELKPATGQIGVSKESGEIRWLPSM